MTIDLSRRRILVVEDEPVLSMDICDQINDHGGVVVGPAVSLQEGAELFRSEKPDACILNIRLGGDLVYGLADEILTEGVPFIFASSEPRSSIPNRFQHVPLHPKPIDMVKAASGLLT